MKSLFFYVCKLVKCPQSPYYFAMVKSQPYKAFKAVYGYKRHRSATAKHLYFGGCCPCLCFARVAFTRCITVSRFWAQYSRLYIAKFLRRAIPAHSGQQYFRYTDIKFLPHTGQIRFTFWLDNCARLRSFPAVSCRCLRSAAQAGHRCSLKSFCRKWCIFSFLAQNTPFYILR